MTIKHSSKLKLVEYLNSASFDDELKLTPNGLLSFHWANWIDSRQYVKGHFIQKEVNAEIEILTAELNELKNKPIWLKNRHKCVKSSMYDLYENYLDPRIRMMWFDHTEEILVSTHNESGPYITLTSMRWMDKEIYASFVRRKIVVGFVPRRSFRVGLDIPVTAFFDNSPLSNVKVILHQATKKGIILKFHNSSDITRALNSKKLNISINLNPILESQSRDINEIIEVFSKLERKDFSNNGTKLIIDTEVFKKYGNEESLKGCDGKEFYIFLNYFDLNGAGEYQKIENCFQNIVEQVEEQFQAELTAA